ncbi:ankyrin repeat domain-containing protein [Thermodesulfobacteriota bacterium]
MPEIAEQPVSLEFWNLVLDTAVAPEKREDFKNEIRHLERLAKGAVKLKHLIGLGCRVEKCEGLEPEIGERIEGADPKDFPILTSAISKPFSVDAQDPKGNTFLLSGSAMPIELIGQDKKPTLVEYVLSVGADPTLKNKHGCSALECAKIHGRSEMIALMVLAMPSVPAEYRNEALLGACRLGDPKKVELLLSKGADINAKDEEGDTPLMAALNANKLSVVELLISKGADLEAKNKNDANALHLASLEGDESLVELLLSKGADIDAKDKDGHTPLIAALNVRHLNKSLVESLLSKGADVKAKAKNGLTALHLACFQGDKPLIELLLSKGADINAKAQNGHTPLRLAEMTGKKEIVEFLKSQGAK